MFQKLEEISMNALPALQSMYVDGWVLRFSHGFTKRANSVHPLYETSGMRLEENILTCEKLYLQENQQVIFKVFGGKAWKDLDQALLEGGYRKEGQVGVQVAPVDSLVAKLMPGVRMVRYDALNIDWLKHFARFSNLTEEEQFIFQKMHELIIPRTGYFLLKDRESDEVLACGLGVLEAEYIGLYNIVTNPDYRKQGFGEQLVLMILQWGQELGAKSAYLQVQQDNEPALALYEKLGFKDCYTYWFRIKDKSDFEKGEVR